MNRRNLIIAGVLVVVAGVGYWAFKQHSDRNEIASLVKDTGKRLRETLAIEAGSPAAIGPEAVQKFEGHFAAAERNRAALKQVIAADKQALVDAADDYLLTGQEILRRQAVAHRNRLLLANSTRTLQQHFRADRGAGSWVREAVRLRAPVEKHYSDYRGAAETLDKLLESLPASQAKIASVVGGAPLAEASLIADARKQSQETLKRATGDIEKIRNVVR